MRYTHPLCQEKNLRPKELKSHWQSSAFINLSVRETDRHSKELKSCASSQKQTNKQTNKKINWEPKIKATAFIHADKQDPNCRTIPIHL